MEATPSMMIFGPPDKDYQRRELMDALNLRESAAKACFDLDLSLLRANWQYL